MKKSTAVATAVLAAGGLLAGCAGAEVGVESASDTSEDAAGAAPRGFEFASGFLEFGDFDPYAIGDEGFNPCTEITEQEFAAAGFDQMRYYDANDPFSNGIAVCNFGGPSDDASAGGFYGGQIDRTIAEENGLILPQFTSASIPELYVIKSKIGIEGACFAQIDTKRGSFGTHFGGPSGRIETDRACVEAINRAEAMFAVFGR